MKWVFVFAVFLYFDVCFSQTYVKTIESPQIVDSAVGKMIHYCEKVLPIHLNQFVPAQDSIWTEVFDINEYIYFYPSCLYYSEGESKDYSFLYEILENDIKILICAFYNNPKYKRIYLSFYFEDDCVYRAQISLKNKVRPDWETHFIYDYGYYFPSINPIVKKSITELTPWDDWELIDNSQEFLNLTDFTDIVGYILTQLKI